MSKLRRVAFIGNHLPRRCGIATFTHDLHRAVATAAPGLNTSVVAMNDASNLYDYPSVVGLQVRADTLTDYPKAAIALNNSGADIVCLQHEFGIFGGEAGANILELLARLEMPIVTTLHTVLGVPTPTQRAVLDQIIEKSAKLIVMSEKGRHFLRSGHGVPLEKIEIIPHGIPEFPFVEPETAKTKFGFSGKSVILTFGLLSPSKGIETVIDAMPAIIRSCPDAVYVVLGATHPNLVRDQGEAYREGLVARADRLGVARHVVFCNQFVDQQTLLEYISMCDVYVTPYLNESQMTSGTLAYSFGLGKAVVSTPYWHAEELLADGRGLLVPFADSARTGEEISALLTDGVRRDALRKRAYATSRSMTWPRIAKRYLTVFEATSGTKRSGVGRAKRFANGIVGERPEPFAAPELRTGHLLAMCDSTGLLQHAVQCVPDRLYGYCIDDNARALLLACRLADHGGPRLPDWLTTRFAAFIQHAWNPDTRRFRNFMSYDRRWLEPAGSEDSHGRTLWALAYCAATDTEPLRRVWASELFSKALGSVDAFSSPRAWAFTLLGLDDHCRLMPGDVAADRLRRRLADRLLAKLEANRTDAWPWFESVLAYDNARLPQALIVSGLATDEQVYTDAGLETLSWLMARQTTATGSFRPIGTESFGKIHAAPAMFDQQPVEATATIAACLVAASADGNPEWAAGAERAFNWFLGANDLEVPLADLATGGCFDGLHPDRPNQNMGAESVLSYLLALVDIRQLTRTGAVPRHPKLQLQPMLALSM